MMPLRAVEIRTSTTFWVAVKSVPHLKVALQGPALALDSHLVRLLLLEILVPDRLAPALALSPKLVVLEQVVLPAVRKFENLKRRSKRCDFRMTRSIRNETFTSRS